MTSLSTFEQLCYCTTRIVAKDANGNSNIGTGFFFNHKVGSEVRPLLFTNKHVVRGMVEGSFLFNTANEQGDPQVGKPFRLNIPKFGNLWKFHPDEDVDLCAMPIMLLIDFAKKINRIPFYKAFTDDLIPSEDNIKGLDAVEEIFMIGYPNGVYDSTNNMPIVRKGITATHPALDYNGKKEFLVDAISVPGSSGSPIFIYDRGIYQGKNNQINIGKSRLYLLGVLHSICIQSVQGKFISKPIATAKHDLGVETNISINLGIALKSERIKELASLFL